MFEFKGFIFFFFWPFFVTLVLFLLFAYCLIGVVDLIIYFGLCLFAGNEQVWKGEEFKNCQTHWYCLFLSKLLVYVAFQISLLWGFSGI